MNPWDINPELSEDRLIIICKAISDMHNSTGEELSEDTPYVRGAACFGRTHQMLIKLGMDNAYEWFRLGKTTMDLVFFISNIPFRFFSTANIDNPKTKTYIRNEYDLFYEETASIPCSWRVLVQKPVTEFDSYEVFIVGYDSTNAISVQWSLTEALERNNTIKEDFSVKPESNIEDIDIPSAQVSKRKDNLKKDG